MLSVDKQLNGLVTIEQAKLGVNAKVMTKTLRGIDVIIDMDRLQHYELARIVKMAHASSP